jgi:hypothetical protein
MTLFLRQTFLLLVALAALAIVLMMIATADAKDIDGTRQIVVEPSAQNEAVVSTESTTGAASTDLTEESAAAPAENLAAEEVASSPSEPEIQAEAEQPEITDRETLARAYLYALYLRAAQRGHGNYGYSKSYTYSYSHGRGYDHCDH